MKSFSNKRRRKSLKPVAIIVAAIVVLLAVGAYAYVNPSKKPTGQSDSKTSQDQTTQANLSTGTSNTTSADSTTDSTKTNSSSDTPAAPSTQSTSGKSTIGISVTSKSQNAETSYKLATQIDTVTTAGSCVLTLTNDAGGNYTQNVGVQALAKTSTCEGFSVPIGSGGISQGNWNYTINYSSDTLMGQTTGTISVQ